MSETRDTRDIVEEVKKTLQKLSLMWPFDPYHPEETAAALDTIEHVGDAIDELARLRRDTGEPVEDAELLHVVGQYIRAHLHMDSDEPNPLLVALRFGDLHDAYNARVHGATPPSPASEDNAALASKLEAMAKAIEDGESIGEPFFLVEAAEALRLAASASERTLDFTAHAERLKKAIEGFAGYSATHHNVGANLIAEASFVVGLLEGMTTTGESARQSQAAVELEPTDLSKLPAGSPTPESTGEERDDG